MFPNILRCFAISSSKSQKEILFKVFLRGIKFYATYDKSNLLMKLSKIQKCYDYDCLKIVYLIFTSLIMI